MLKKILFVVAVLALLVPAGYARTIIKDDKGNALNPDWEYDGATAERKAESYNWPASYNFVELGRVKVKMDVGFWFKAVDINNKTIILRQVEIHKYAGSTTLSIVCNVAVALDWAFEPKANTIGYYEIDWGASGISPSTLDAPGGTVTLSLTLNAVDLSKSTGLVAGVCNEIGAFVIKVKPNVTPVLAGGC